MGTRHCRESRILEISFEVREAEEGGYTARALGYSIFTEAETWDELRDNVREVTSLHFEDEAIKPDAVIRVV